MADTQYKGVTLRDDVIKAVETEARQQHRSFSAQVAYILEQWKMKKEANTSVKQGG